MHKSFEDFIAARNEGPVTESTVEPNLIEARKARYLNEAAVPSLKQIKRPEVEQAFRLKELMEKAEKERINLIKKFEAACSRNGYSFSDSELARDLGSIAFEIGKYDAALIVIESVISWEKNLKDADAKEIIAGVIKGLWAEQGAYYSASKDSQGSIQGEYSRGASTGLNDHLAAGSNAVR